MASQRGENGSPPGDDATARIVRGLQDPARYPHAAGPIELIETHISYVLLTGAYAYKIKKPLRLPFLDFSTLEKRRQFCEAELELNRRFSPELYVDVVPIGGTPDAPEIGRTPAIEYAVKLVQFDPDATADRLVERGVLNTVLVERFAETVAEFHLAAPAAEGRHPGRLSLENVAELETALAAAGIDHPVDDIAAFTKKAAAALDGKFAERRRAGAVRDCHGDLHLENVVLHAGRLRAFDALEFDRSLRSMDVIDEVAFLFMDFTAHTRPDLAHVLLNRYLEITGDYVGTACVAFYTLYRALVRAKVRAIKAAQAGIPAAERVAPYLALARSLIRPRAPRLILTYGLSGSGKTTVTGELVARLPAIRLRSDLERKRLAGVAPDTHEELPVGAGRYSTRATDETYAALAAGAEAALAGGLDVIVDATFLSRQRRRELEPVAARHGATVTILACDAPEAELRRRIRARAAARSDASEATEAVLDAQLASAQPPTAEDGLPVVRVDTTERIDYDDLVKALRRAT